MTPKLPYTIGIDGGGTRCRGRLRNINGKILAEDEAGSANVHLNFLDSITTIKILIGNLFRKAEISAIEHTEISLGLGLAGILASGDEHRVANEFLDFGRVIVASDAVTACIGAHGDCDGGLVIAGTGTAGLARLKGKAISIGGRGFALGDDGSGARIGWDALRQALLAADGLRDHTQLTRKVMARFDNDSLAITRWSLSAKSGDYASFAPIVFDFANNGDDVALPIIKDAAKAIHALALAVSALGVTNIALVGGISGAISPYLSQNSKFDIVKPERDPIDGAIMLAGGNIA